MAKKIKFASGTATKKSDIIDQEIKKMTPDNYIEPPADTEEQMTIQAYRDLVARLLPEIKKAKQKGGLVATAENVGGKTVPLYKTVNVASIARREELSKEEIQKIWDMV
jgi:hypothetical protein